jgi:hypothetical protein
MHSEIHHVWRKYLDQGGRYRLVKNLASACMIIVAGPFLAELGRYFPPAAVFAPVFSDPFAILSGLILLASYMDLHYMEFKLQQNQPPILFNLDSLERQRAIPKRYEQIFGNDLLVKAWKLRLIFVAFFLVAALRWVATWKVR